MANCSRKIFSILIAIKYFIFVIYWINAILFRIIKIHLNFFTFCHSFSKRLKLLNFIYYIYFFNIFKANSRTILIFIYLIIVLIFNLLFFFFLLMKKFFKNISHKKLKYLYFDNKYFYLIFFCILNGSEKIN